MDEIHQDPAEIRRQAALLRSASETIETLVQRLDQRVEGMEFEGPAALRFRAVMEERTQRGRSAARELDELATTLLAAAHAGH